MTTDQLTPIVDAIRGRIGIVTGGFVVSTGVYYLLGRTTGGVHLPGLKRLSDWLTGYVDRLASGPGIVGLEVLHGLLPCPVLCPAYLSAFAIDGAVALAALGVGTIPAVFAYGTIIEAVDVVHRQRVHCLLRLAFVVLGYVLLAYRLMSVRTYLPHPELPFYDIHHH